MGSMADKTPKIGLGDFRRLAYNKAGQLDCTDFLNTDSNNLCACASHCLILAPIT